MNLYINSGEIIRGMYNVLPISKSKGLEFEKVIVLANGMSDNEFYVACTRAISELYVIENKWFACNNAYCINEKKAIKLLETFEYKPKKYAERVNHIFDGSIQCLSPAKNYKLYKSSINKSLYFVQRSLSSGTRGQRVTAQLNLSREWKNRMTTVVISAILNPVSRLSTPY